MKLLTEIKTESAIYNNRQWFAVQTYTLKEPIAKINFEQQGFKVYLPQIKTIRKHARRVDLVNKAFFAGYLFLQLEPHERQWQTISSTRGVIRPVSFGDYYPPVPDWVIVELRSREDERGFIILDKDEKYREGDKVKISLLSDMEQTGIFKELYGNERALILLDILQEQARAVVPLSALSFC
ncbi:MAG: transcriptional activator RfaH [Deltaproteobacteria bacterium]|nr:transcriptional activator RfaH [Deltaproteobacteria bacterium]